ncbi:D-lactate dehydrogenase [Sphingomonas zeicaulis]|uniref:D-lactate dehydrogenase n=1 Tax=Sphingomonas zeicaulis TaxID=1632740 RepID=UPI003D256AF6
MPPQTARQPAAPDQPSFVEQLRATIGRDRVVTGATRTRRYRMGFRFGEGAALAVVRPRSLVEMWRALQLCIAHDKIVIMQAANTGLTGGSTPSGDDYDRDVVIISTTAMSKIHVIDEGRQVICLAGATLYELEAALRPYGREPHSVIGSSCIGASVLGGVCNNSGGALVRRGPAFTELALFAQRQADGALRLVNHLGVDLGIGAEEMLARLDSGAFAAADIVGGAGRASDHDYATRVRDIAADTPARFNADPQCLFEASGSAGKLAVFAVRLDTFPKDADSRVFYIGTNDPAELGAIRRAMLERFAELPIAAEYMHRDCFDIAEDYGKSTFLAINLLGTERLPMLYAVGAKLGAIANRIGIGADRLGPRLIHGLARLLPRHLPRRLTDYRDRYEHHLILRMGGAGIAEAEAYLGTTFPSASGDFFTCSPAEGEKAFLHRFAAAGAAIQYRKVHADAVEGIIALDIALPRNSVDWVEVLPPTIADQIVHSLYYGHFFCHVFHQDYVLKKGADPHAVEHAMLELLDARGAEYPAEHGVGHLYEAKPALRDFYRELDPCNSFNPGIGHTARKAHWQ